MVPTIENPYDNGQQRPAFRAHRRCHPDNLRSDSNESTRSARYQGTTGSDTGARNSAPLAEGLSAAQRADLRDKGSSKHRSNKESQPEMSYRDSMGDVADMAIRSLGTDEIEALFGTYTSSPLRQGEQRAHHPGNDPTLPIPNATSSYRDMGIKSGAFPRHTPLSLDTILWDTDKPSAWGPGKKFGKKNTPLHGVLHPPSTLRIPYWIATAWGPTFLIRFKAGYLDLEKEPESPSYGTSRQSIHQMLLLLLVVQRVSPPWHFQTTVRTTTQVLQAL
jgi:hypothetical protein